MEATASRCRASIPPRLPLELIIITIQHLVDDRQTLAACSLTCRAWLDIGRMELFRSLHFKFEGPHFDHKLSSLLDFFTSAPHLSRHTICLTIAAQDTASRNCMLGRITTSRLEALVNAFPNLQELELSNIAWRATYVYQTQRIKVLRLTTVSSRDCNDWLNLIHAFPRLQTLTVDRFFIPIMAENNNELPAPQIEGRGPTLCDLRSLDIEYTPLASRILTTLGKASEFKALDTVSVNCIHLCDIIAVQSMLRTARATITRLQLTMTLAAGSTTQPFAELFGSFDFACLTSLRSIAFSLIYETPTWLWHCIISLLSRTAPSLQVIQFRIMFRYYYDVPWFKLDQMLASQPYAKRVEFANYLEPHEETPANFAHSIKAGLPLTYEKGLLFVHDQAKGED